MANYQRRMKLAEEHERGLVSIKEFRKDLDAAWDEAEAAMETDRSHIPVTIAQPPLK